MINEIKFLDKIAIVLLIYSIPFDTPKFDLNSYF